MLKKFGRIDILVNNAGVSERTLLNDYTEELFDKVMDLNVKGVFNATRAVVDAMTEQGSGVILCHENEKGIYGDNEIRCAEIHRALPELKAVFDPANFVQCEVDTLAAWELLKPYTYYGHIKDADANGRVVPPGTGLGHLREYLPDLLKNSSGILTMEPHLTKFVGLSALENGDDKAVGGLSFATPRAAFDYAVKCLREILD